MTCLEMQTEFDRTICLEPTAVDGSFTIDLPDVWMALVGIHGGYLTSLAVRAAEALVAERNVRTLTTSFLRSARPGPAELRVEEVRRGRSVSNVAATLSQNDRDIAATRLTMVTDQVGVEWQRSEPLGLPPVSECVPIAPPAERGVRTTHFDRAHGLLDPSSIPFTNGPRAMVRGYMRPREPRPVDAAWLAMASDWFPPPAFVSLDPPTGGISVDLTTHIHTTLRDPVTEWLSAKFEIATSTGGLATEHGRIVAPDGTLLAESIQTRWTATQ